MADDTSPSGPEPQAPAAAPESGFWSRRKAEIGLAILAVYVVLLAVGTFAELFDVRWILAWPIY